MSEPTRILATDCGSTTTKAILIEKRDGHWQLIVRGEAPTTVEAPYDDVTVGVRNAVREVEELSGLELMGDDGLLHPAEGSRGVDLYLSTSSAGGGLQMTVAGVVKAMSAESAERAALGAGAIIMDVVAVDDGRKDWQKIERIRSLRPDMVLVSGGTDGGTVSHLVDIAEMIVAADPKPRLGGNMRLPVIYAGTSRRASRCRNSDGGWSCGSREPAPRPGPRDLSAQRQPRAFLQPCCSMPRVRKTLRRTTRLMSTRTPWAAGRNRGRSDGMQVLAVDIAGHDGRVLVFGGVFNRTVSANLGRSYSTATSSEAGALICALAPFESDEWAIEPLRNR